MPTIETYLSRLQNRYSLKVQSRIIAILIIHIFSLKGVENIIFRRFSLLCAGKRKKNIISYRTEPATVGSRPKAFRLGRYLAENKLELEGKGSHTQDRASSRTENTNASSYRINDDRLI